MKTLKTDDLIVMRDKVRDEVSLAVRDEVWGAVRLAVVRAVSNKIHENIKNR